MAGGKVTNDGQLPVTEYGFYWSTTSEPEPTGSNFVKITAGSDEDFDYLSYDLLAGTQYFVRAYAKNAVGIGYSDEVAVKTPEIAYGEMVSFGKTYKTVAIGNQTWMAEDIDWDGETRFSVSQMKSIVSEVCPAEWYVPTQQEWSDLIAETGGRDIAPKVLRVSENSFLSGINSSGLSIDATSTPFYWTSTIYEVPNAPHQNGFHSVLFLSNYVTSSQESSLSSFTPRVRCIKNQ
jgi:hypothetical protein